MCRLFSILNMMLIRENKVHYNFMGQGAWNDLILYDILQLKPIPEQINGNMFWLKFLMKIKDTTTITDGTLAIGCPGSYIDWNNKRYETEEDLKTLWREIENRNIERTLDIL